MFAAISAPYARAGARAGLAFNPDTPFTTLEPYLEEIDLLLVMSVVPGFGGQGFMETSWPTSSRRSGSGRSSG